MAVNVSAQFTKDERENDGLRAIEEVLVKDPLRRHVVVAVIETSAVTTSYRKGGVVTPTVRLVNVEVMDGDRAVAARELLDTVYRQRTGRDENPQSSLFERGDDPTAGPWPGDSDYAGDTVPGGVEDPPPASPKRGRRGEATSG